MVFKTRLEGLYREGGLWIVPLLLVVSSSVFAVEWQVNERDFNHKRAPQLAVTADQGIAVGYYDTDGNIIVRKHGGQSTTLNSDPRRKPPSGLILMAAENRLYAAWREQRERIPTLVLRSSADGGNTWEPEVIIDNTTQPLTRIEVKGDGQGHLYVVWLGAQKIDDESSPPVASEEGEEASTDRRARSYHIYARYSPDGGQNWGKVQRLTAGYAGSIWPTLITRGEKAYSFSWSQEAGEKKIIFAKTDKGDHWQTPTVVKEVGDVLLLKPLIIGDRLFVLWLNKYGNYQYVVEGAFSDDEGKTWTDFVLDETRGLDIANIDIAVQDRNVYVVFSARKARPTEPWKQTVYFIHSADGGETWGRINTLRHYPFEYTNALYPRVVADQKAVTVAWNDYRNIRGDLYLNYSRNTGVDWLPHDIPIDSKGRDNDFLYPFADSFTKLGEDYYLLGGRYVKDAFGGQADLLLHKFELQQPEPHSDLLGDLGSPEKVSLLRKRVLELWESLVSEDYETAYTLFDPFFRANFRKVDYLSSTGLINFHSFKVKDVAVYGNIGKVNIEYEYEVPEVMTKHGKFSRPQTTAERVETWVFVSDKWYKEYYNELGEFTYTRY